MLPKYISETQLLSDLTPERQARFLLKMRNKCYITNGVYIEESDGVWELTDILEALNSLPHVRSKKSRSNKE